jgi:hypothetical protein
MSLSRPIDTLIPLDAAWAGPTKLFKGGGRNRCKKEVCISHPPSVTISASLHRDMKYSTSLSISAIATGVSFACLS